MSITLGERRHQRGRAAERRVLDAIRRVIRARGSRCDARMATTEEDRAGVDIVVREPAGRRSRRRVLIQVKASRCRKGRGPDYYAAKGIAVVITRRKSDDVLDAEVEWLIGGVL